MAQAQIIGVENTSFTGKDGTPVTGKTIYVTEEISPKRGKGKRADRIFLSNAKLSNLDFAPELDQTVEIYYNRYRKVETMRLVDDAEIVID